MCGILGFWHVQEKPQEVDSLAVLERMSTALTHRGPDSHGQWFSESKALFLAHRRLSILDLSSSGHQPMVSKAGRYTIVFNGEIYNFSALKRGLERTHSIIWNGSSDTEVLLASIETYGLKETLEKIVGMFAFALWDEEKKTLQLVRDRFGEKPLYWGSLSGTFVFSSELKAIKEYPSFDAEIDRSALSFFMAYGYTPKSQSIYKGIRKAQAGSIVTLYADGTVEESIYWSARTVALKGQRNQFQGNEFEAIDCLDELLTGSIKDQLVADVPVGAFLSGGTDSSLISAIAQRVSSQPIKTFTIGFHEEGFNEAVYAKEVAKAIGSEHFESYVSETDMLQVVPLLPYLYDEPFADPSQIPTCLVSKLARSKVVVSLSGDGGDELFGGYNRYTLTKAFWERFGFLPFAARKLLAVSLKAVPVQYWDAVGNMLGKLEVGSRLPQNFGDKLEKLANLIGSSRTLPETYDALLYHWSAENNLVINGSHESLAQSDWAGLDPTHSMMLLDTESYLTDDILVKVDRASMGVSLESRVPMLDHRIFEFAWSLPLEMKQRSRQGKWILRELLYRYVSPTLLNRPKVGFAAPVGQWIRGPLKSWAENLLDESAMHKQGYLNVPLVQKIWQEHKSGKRNWQYRLWHVLMFQAWLEKEV